MSQSTTISEPRTTRKGAKRWPIAGRMELTLLKDENTDDGIRRVNDCGRIDVDGLKAVVLFVVVVALL